MHYHFYQTVVLRGNTKIMVFGGGSNYEKIDQDYPGIHASPLVLKPVEGGGVVTFPYLDGLAIFCQNEKDEHVPSIYFKGPRRQVKLQFKAEVLKGVFNYTRHDGSAAMDINREMLEVLTTRDRDVDVHVSWQEPASIKITIPAKTLGKDEWGTLDLVYTFAEKDLPKDSEGKLTNNWWRAILDMEMALKI